MTNLTAQLKRLFWDHILIDTDFEKYPVWIAERVLEYGTIKDIIKLREAMGKEKFLKNCCSGFKSIHADAKLLVSNA